MSYKIIQDGEVVSVIDSPIWVTQLANGSVIRCDLAKAIGVVSADGEQTYHIVGAKQLVSSGRQFIDVEAVYIEETEAEELKTLLGLGASVDKDSDVVWEESISEEDTPELIDNGTLSEVKERKLPLLLADSRQAVYSGVDVELSDGSTEHFELGIDEQLDLITLYSLASIGTEQIPFHNSDGECKYYTNSDILNIINAANKLKMYHAAYMDSLKKWVLSMQSIAEVGSVKYGDDIPIAYRTEVFQDIVSGT